MIDSVSPASRAICADGSPTLVAEVPRLAASATNHINREDMRQ
jgi:hypothetical protein